MSETPVRFTDLGLPPSLLQALSDIGYETPSPIQAATIPHVMSGKDIVGMAQTGTGKTAAFALPVLANIDTQQKSPQALVLCPTRELAIQVSEAFQSYAAHIKGFHVLPVYGGQDMRGQLKALQRGVHVVVGTPGRILDHLQRKSLNLSQLKTLVLDEADEMLRMGFIDDVETILSTTPESRQVALFSATMPKPIRRVAEKYLKKPVEVRIETAVTTNENIEQCYWLVAGTNKLDALTRILEVESFDGMIIFVRTKTATVELADKLNARGFSASALNGDMNQALRQRTVEMLKNGKLDILVATDVAARGLDVERISHVMNFDIPYDDEAYVHRIGRTGRAGRTGKAILFVAPRERRLLRSIEKTTRQEITRIDLPSRNELMDKRARDFKSQVAEVMATGDGSQFQYIVDQLCQEQNSSAEDIAATLVYLLQKDKPLVLPKEKPLVTRESRRDFNDDDSGNRERGGRNSRKKSKQNDVGMESYKIDVGKEHDVTPREIVGAIANEAGIEGQYIGQIRIQDSFTIVDLPEGMPKEVFQHLKKIRVKQRPLNIEKCQDSPNTQYQDDKKPSKAGPKKRVRKREDARRSTAKKKTKKK
ncbi:ATP-dependent RNA helicase DeaD [Thalassocella blandensis]|nr:ATP-dependent RNA helicase DeaD [Thalassocella blandensis]